MTMCRSASEGAVPFRLASMTRRQASTVTSSPRSLAASSTFQATSSDLSGVSSSETAPVRSSATAPNENAFMVMPPPILCRSSLRKTRGLARHVGTSGRSAFAGLVKFQNAPGRLDVEMTVFVFEVLQVVRGDAVILGAEKQQRHGRVPRKVQGLGENQQRLPVAVQQGSFDHVAGQ